MLPRSTAVLLCCSDIMYGSIGAWLYRYVAGVELNGLDTIVVRPRMAFDWTLMKRMQAEVVTVKGRVAVQYTRGGEEGRDVELDVTLPSNTRAVVVMEPTSRGGTCHALWESNTLLIDRRAGVMAGSTRDGEVEGVAAVTVDVHGAVSLEVGGGRYRFHAKWS